MKHYKNGDLETYIKKRKETGYSFTERDIMKILIEVMESLKALHSRRIIHRDVKFRNILVDDEGKCRLTDFDVSRTLSEDEIMALTIKGTVDFMAPEVFLGVEYSFSVDIFSVGVIIYELMMGGKPFPTGMAKTAEQFKPILSKSRFSHELIQLTNQCLSITPTERPTAMAILTMPFVCYERMMQAGNWHEDKRVRIWPLSWWS